MVFSKEESFGKLFEMMRADNVFKDSGISEDVVKSKSAPQNPKTEKEPELNAEDLDLEDYEDQELNGPDAKGKSKSPENPKYAIRNVSDEETSNPKPKETTKEAVNQKSCPKCSHQPMYLERGTWFCDNCGYTVRIKPHVGRELTQSEIAGLSKIGKKPSSETVESKSGNLYLCNECFKTFRNSKPICIYCNSSIVESILEKEEIKETVEELIGEVPGIDRHSQDLLRWALKKGTIPNEFPNEEVIIDALSAEDVVPDEEAFKSAEPSHIKIYYLKYVLLPRAKKEYLRTEGINPSNNDDIDTKIKKLTEDNKSAIELAYEIVDLISMQSSDGKDRRGEIQERAKRIAIGSKRAVLESEFFEDKYGLSNIRAKMIDIMYNMGYSLSEEQKAEEDKTLLTFRKGEDVVEVKVLDSKEKG